ncbi:hypothetical protein K504DRAFT_386012, partial [Pleomassaria siparia CBS 279.74]
MDNPAIVAYHFHRRLKVFFEEILKPKFNVTDSWHRYEWQARGSTHNHGLFWSDGAPDPDAHLFSPELKQQLADFWGIHIAAINPEPARGHQQAYEERSPMSIIGKDMPNTFKVLSELANRLQLHVHSDTYCMRVVKGTRQGNHQRPKECRFYMPDDLRDRAIIGPTPGRSFERFLPARNDGMINKYNRLFTMSWMANTDVSPCTSKKAVQEYVGKYAGKCETKSPGFRAIAEHLIPFVNNNMPYQSFVTKLMNKLIGDRDYSAQEVCHMLLDLPLSLSSRTVINVDLRPENTQPHLYHLEQGETRQGKSLLMKYKERSKDEMDGLQDIPYITFLKSHAHISPYKNRPRAQERVLNVYPRYNPEDVDNYGRAKLMLHHPFYQVNDLLYIPEIGMDEPCDNFALAYEFCRGYCDHSLEPDGLDDVEIELEESVHEDAPDIPEDGNDIDASFGELARQLPTRAGANLDIEDCLGGRLLDLQADWTDRIGNHDVHSDWWKEQKTNHPVALQVVTASTPDDLLPKQRLINDTVVTHYQDILSGFEPNQLLLNVDGEGGTGKTVVIRVLCVEL